MKKRIFALGLALMMLFCVSAQAGTNDFYRRVQYGIPVLYENMVYGYSLNMFARFISLNDDAVEDYLSQPVEEGKEALYDVRVWYSPDGRYTVQVQVKEPTYDSFETEVAMAPEYAAIVGKDYTPEEEFSQYHLGIVRDTPAGSMLEMAHSMNVFMDDDTVQRPMIVYYDFYYQGLEYIFLVLDWQGDYAAAQSMADEIAQSARFVAQISI